MARYVPDPLPRFGDRRRMRVGLLGGSFNPAHEGHRHVAELALARLALDQVWLMVSPGNPLKPIKGMARFTDRLSGAAAIGDGRRVIATSIEAAVGHSSYTVDTLRELRSTVSAGAFCLDHGSRPSDTTATVAPVAGDRARSAVRCTASAGLYAACAGWTRGSALA